MISLAIFDKMSEDQVAGLTAGKDFFWEEFPLLASGKTGDGAWLVSRGGSNTENTNGLNLRETIDIYVAFANKMKTERIHEQIRKWIASAKGFCELTGTADDGEPYAVYNVRIRLTTTPANDGITETGLIVKVASLEAIYDDLLK